jgi:hypothetical protein
MKQFQWNFKNIAFFIISILVLAFAFVGVFTDTLSRDQSIGLVGVIISANLPSPLLNLDNKAKKKVYLGLPPIEATDN